MLEIQFTTKEIHKALSEMPNNKWPGPGGDPAEFYKHFWDMSSQNISI